MSLQEIFQLSIVIVGLLILVFLFLFSPRVRETKQLSQRLGLAALGLGTLIAFYTFLVRSSPPEEPASPSLCEIECDSNTVVVPGEIECSLYRLMEDGGERIVPEDPTLWRLLAVADGEAREGSLIREDQGPSFRYKFGQPGEFVLEAISGSARQAVRILAQLPPEPSRKSRVVSIDLGSSYKPTTRSQSIRAQEGYRIIEWEIEAVSERNAKLRPVEASIDGSQLLLRAFLKPKVDLFQRERAYLRVKVRIVEEEIIDELAEPHSRADG